VRGSVAPIGSLSSLKLPVLKLGLPIDDLLIDVEFPNDVLIDDASPTGCDRTHCKLLMARHPEFSHHEYIQRSVQRHSDLVRDRDPAARKREHNDIVSITVGRQTFGQHPASFGSVSESAPIHR
jgi:hypothetical protein